MGKELSIGNIINNIVIPVCGANWSTGNIEGTLCKVYDCLTTKLYTENQYIIIILKRRDLREMKPQELIIQPHYRFSTLSLMRKKPLKCSEQRLR